MATDTPAAVGPWALFGAWSVLVVPPVEEPLTLAEGKLRAGLDWPTTIPEDPRDQLMRDHIAAARAQVEQDTGLALLTQTRDVRIVSMAGAPELLALPAQSLPLQEVLAVWTEDGTPVPVRRDTTPLVVIRGRAWLRADVAGVSDGIARVKVGYTDPAELRARAPGLLQAVGLLTAHYATAGRDLVVTGTIATTIPNGYEDTIQPYRLVWLI